MQGSARVLLPAADDEVVFVKNAIGVTIAMIALLLLVGAPFCFSFNGGAAHGGLACYCCSGAKGDCIMAQCPICHTHDGRDVASWLPDLVPSSFQMPLFARPATRGAERFMPPETVYLEVPVKPPRGGPPG